MATDEQQALAKDLSSYKYGWHDETPDLARIPKGLSEDVIRQISTLKGEPEWMLTRRLKALRHFESRPLPTWGPDLSALDFQDIFYYVLAGDRNAKSWDDVPIAVKNTFNKLGIPEAEQKFLSGVAAQFDSEAVYHNLREELSAQGVIFTDTDTALKEHPELFREYFGTVIPANDNKLAALNTAAWSGGSFVWVPPGVHVETELSAYFRINSQSIGQLERTLIVVEKGASVKYTEGCTAPNFSSNTLHSAVVEIIVKEGAKCTYSTLQNWSSNVYNLVTKRAVVQRHGQMHWIDVNLGCLAEGSSVTTPRGTIPIETVEVGQKVLAYDEQTGKLCWRKVRAKRFSGVQPVREVSVQQRKLRTTDQHPFYSFSHDATRAKKLGRYKLGYRRADELTRAIVPIATLPYGRPYKLRRENLTRNFTGRNQHGATYPMTKTRTERLGIETTTTDDLMWLFGLFLGDGSIATTAAKSGGLRFANVTFSVPRKDRARKRLVQVMKQVLPGVRPNERKDGVTLHWSSVDFANLFLQNGFATGARVKRLPNWVHSLPESQRLALVAGYLDSDGCALSTTRGLSIKSVNRPLLRDIAQLLTSLAITSRLHCEFEGERKVRILGHDTITRGSYLLAFPADRRLLPYVTPAMRKIVAQQPTAIALHRVVGRSQIQLPSCVEVRAVKSGPVGEARTWDIEVEGDGNFISDGFIVHNSKLTMKYPSVYLVGEYAHGEVLSAAFASTGQNQDAGAKMIHAAPNTTSLIHSKSVSRGEGRTSYRGLVKIYPNAHGSKSTVRCDALILDASARSDTYPVMEVDCDDVTIGHEASVSKVGEEQLFYLMSRGMGEAEAIAMIVNGFVEPIVKTLPMDYALEMNRLILLQMQGALG